MKKILCFLFLLISSYCAGQVTHCTVTYYQPVKAQTNNQPLITADGSKINLNELRKGHIKWCAISRDLLYLFPKNKPKKVYIEGFGEYEVRDVMNKRHIHRIDILIHPKDSRLVYKSNVKVRIIK